MTFTEDIIVTDLQWDSFNIEHTQKHGLTKEDVEAGCQNLLKVIESHSNRYHCICGLPNGQTIVIILAYKGNNSFYPVTARPANRKERQEVDKEGGEPIPQ